MSTAGQTAIKAAMSVAKDIAEGRLAPASLADVALTECRTLFGAVVGPDDPLWPLQAEVARQVLAAGGIPANELQEWLAVQRQREGVPVPDPVPTKADCTCPDPDAGVFERGCPAHIVIACGPPDATPLEQLEPVPPV